MENKREILNEIRGVSPILAEIAPENLYSVPANYFEEFSAKVLQTIQSTYTSNLPVSSTGPFSLPDGYFNDLSRNIMSAIKQEEFNEVDEELKHIAPSLLKISRKNIYPLPVKYFENFEVSPVKKAEASIVRLTPFRRYISYAAAAVIIFIMSIGAFVYFAKTDQSAPVGNNVNLSEEVDKLTDAEIIEYLNTNSSASNTKSSINNNQSFDSEISEHLDNLDSEEMKEYLREHEEPGEAQYEGI